MSVPNCSTSVGAEHINVKGNIRVGVVLNSGTLIAKLAVISDNYEASVRFYDPRKHAIKLNERPNNYFHSQQHGAAIC
jgi:hypothetical protein